jgi:hypothetical protein
VGRRDVPGPSTDFSVTDGLRWIGNHNSAAPAISQNGYHGAERELDDARAACRVAGFTLA